MKARWISLCLAAALAGCGPTISHRITVSHDYRRDVDFARLRTYQWIPLSKTIETGDFDRDVLASMKIAFTEAFEAKGYRRVESNPDFLVALYLAKAGKIISSDWGFNYGWDSRSWNDYWMERRVSAKEVDKGTLILDVVHAGDKKSIWYGTASTVIIPGASGAKRNERIDEAVAGLLARFPPP